MKTKVILIILATTAIVSFGASRISKSNNEKAQVAQSNDATLGGFAAEDK